MYFAYIDDSGNVGALPGGTITYTLGCVMFEAARWPAVFDETIAFRRFLRARFKIPVRAEIKANFLLHNKGPFYALGLSEAARFAVYRGCLRLQRKLAFKVFAVVIRKDLLAALGSPFDPREVAWEYLFQRLERFTTLGSTQVFVLHDEGEAHLIRRLQRKARRAGTAGSMFGTGSLSRPAKLVLDDPVSRSSREAYFVQMADLDAYAAFRRLYPPPARPVQVVPTAMWDELGDARYGEVNKHSGGPVAIVAWP
jgi:uncharacterized protein DUF3800